jgi:hypothetical protein
MRINNVAHANDFLKRDYRQGWGAPSAKTS